MRKSKKTKCGRYLEVGACFLKLRISKEKGAYNLFTLSSKEMRRCKEMLLAIDIGNTNIVMGVMNGMELISSFRLTTQTPRTSDEYGIMMVDLLRQRGLEAKDITAVIISSVVPDIMYSFSNGLKRYLHQILHQAVREI